MKQIIPEIVILSASISELSYGINYIRNQRLREILVFNNIKYQAVQGVYLDEKELSFVVWLDYPKGYNKEYFLNIADSFNQESILYRDSSKRGYLFYCDNNDEEFIGIIDKISVERAEKLACYIYFPLTQEYIGVVS